MRLGMGGAMRTSGAASLRTGAQGLIDDGLDGTRAAAAFGATAEATIDLLGIPGEVVFRTTDRTADIMVGQDVARTNNHETAWLFHWRGRLIDIQADDRLQKEKPCFRAIPNYQSQSRTALKCLQHRHKRDFWFTCERVSIATAASTTITAARAVAGRTGKIRPGVVTARPIMRVEVDEVVGVVAARRILRAAARGGALGRAHGDPHQTGRKSDHQRNLQRRRPHRSSPCQKRWETRSIVRRRSGLRRP